MSKKAGPRKKTPIESLRHKDKRKNIPTEELRDFVVAEEEAPQYMLYPRDPSLDPQLVWKGKDEQDRKDLAVPVVPIYIQEKIHPQALVENLRDTAKPGEAEPEAQLLWDFNGLGDDFDKKVDFYQHDQHWSNRMILAAVARHADQETLFDQPYEDPKRIRVTGPFTVESLSPHRVLAAEEEQPASEAAAGRESSADFATMIIDNLRKAGVQNTKKKERLAFDSLAPYAGAWIHAAGAFTDSDGKSKRVAVSIGPEHGTVGPQQVKEAAKEAVQGVGFDILIVCGFAFDPHVTEEAKRYGKLTVLPARMNPDLAMGDELLKKTGAGNLFMVFGEPDLDIRKTKDGKLVAEIKGVDVYDPTTGEIRSSSTDDIACWLIDTNYNSESFFVRHAYFTGADEPYEKLKRALRAEIDEGAWASLYSTVSRPFDPPETGKIAVKVINHYGDEVLKVFEV